MRKRIFFPILIFLVFFPVIVFVLSYTRLFNEQLRSVLTSIVDEQTNARLYVGEIHGSIFGSFRIDGAALLYRNEPIAQVDTIRISHMPLSLLTKTIEAMRVELVNPRFYLMRFKDGTFNVDHISKGSSHQGGRFDWTVISKSVRIIGGHFFYYDSTRTRTDETLPPDSMPGAKFDASHFSLKNIDLTASANISDDNLSANIKNLSLDVSPSGFRIDSLRFGFFTSAAGTEVSGFDFRSGSAVIHADLTLMGQNLLDSLEVKSLREKHLTADIDARNLDIKQIERFIDLPLDPVSKFDLTCFLSGSLDTLNVKQFFLNTDSSYIPMTATLYNVVDSSLRLRAETNRALISMPELSSLLKRTGFPNLGELRAVQANVTATGNPRDLNLNLQLKSGEAEVAGTAHIYSGSYDGDLRFQRIDLARILSDNNLKTQLTGEATFSLKTSRGTMPDGRIVLTVDSSSFDQAAISNFAVSAASDRDSLNIKFNLLTSRGKAGGSGTLNMQSKSYYANISFGELDPASFVSVPTLEGSFTGSITLSGSGFDIDSLDTRLSLTVNHSRVGDLLLDSSSFRASLNTSQADKSLKFRSPYLDATVIGNFVPHRFPQQLSSLFSFLAESFSDRMIGRHDSLDSMPADMPDLNASVDVDVKDASFVGKLLGVEKLEGDPKVRFNVASNKARLSLDGSAAADTFGYARDSLRLNASKVNMQFSLQMDSTFAVWDSGDWSISGRVGALDINQTKLAAKVLQISYTPHDSTGQNLLSISAIGQVDSLLEFYADASANVKSDSINLTFNTLLGKLYGVSLTSLHPVHVVYLPEAFLISPTDFSAGIGGGSTVTNSRVSVEGEYSLEKGADLHFMFNSFDLPMLQEIARIDTNSLKLIGVVNGSARLADTEAGTVVSIDFNGDDISYNGSVAKLMVGTVNINNDYMELSARLSKQNDSTRYALRLDGIIPLSDRSPKGLHLGVTADSLEISFLAPFLSGVRDFGGKVSGGMMISGQYSSPELDGKMQVADGKIRLAVNDIDYLFDGTIVGQGSKLLLAPLTIRNVPHAGGGTMVADGSLEIRDNTVEEFDIGLNGSLLVLNSNSHRSVQGIYGTAVVGAGREGLRLKGSLTKPLLEGTVSIGNADLTLLPLQKQETAAPTQEIIYHFPADTAARKGPELKLAVPAVTQETASSGSIIDSLRYDVNVEARGNENLRMIFDPATNEELNALLGGQLHLSNFNGTMELTGDVDVQNSSYYNFYNKQFAATGKLHFTGDPLDPALDITAKYQSSHDTSTTKAPQVVVVQLRVTGTFNQPKTDISLTLDNSPFQGDPQTNAVSFILTGQFADELTSSQKQNVANNLWSQVGSGAIASFGSSLLSGALTNLLGSQFSFIQSAGLQYNPNTGITDPNFEITARIEKATIKVGRPVLSSDITNTGFTLNYPVAPLLGNMVYLELSRNVEVNNRVLSQREATDMLRLFYQLSF